MNGIPNLDSPLKVTVTPLHVPTHNEVAAQSLYLSQTSFGHISTNSSTIPTVLKLA